MFFVVSVGCPSFLFSMTVGLVVFSFDFVQQEDNIPANSALEGHGTVWSLQFLALLAYADPFPPQEAWQGIHGSAGTKCGVNSMSHDRHSAFCFCLFCLKSGRWRKVNHIYIYISLLHRFFMFLLGPCLSWGLVTLCIFAGVILLTPLWSFTPCSFQR